MNIFALAAKNAYRYKISGGNITTEDLWNLTLPQLDTLAVQYDAYLTTTPTKSFINKENPTDKIIEVKFTIVKEIIEYKLKVQETAAKAAATKAQRSKIMEIMAEKQDGALQEKSLAELQAMLDIPAE